MINIQNIDDNEYFQWSIVGYLNPADRSLARITKADKEFTKKLDFKDIKAPLNIRDIHKIEKIEFYWYYVFGYENKRKTFNLCIKKVLWRRTCWFIIDRKEGKNTRFLSKILILTYMIMRYIVEENIFVIVVYNLLIQTKY